MPSSSQEKMATLIATLGTEPQVVTAAVDLLLRQGNPIARVIVVHTESSNANIRNAVLALKNLFHEPPYIESIEFELVSITDPRGRPLQDVKSFEEARAAFRVLYRLVRDAKQRGDQVHLSIAGGRKTIAVFGMATAQLLFDEGDRLWHLYSGGDFLESKRLHPEPGDEVQLIPIPFIQWAQVSPVMTDLMEIEDPFEAAERVQSLQLAEKVEIARAFVLGALTPAERRAVNLLAQEGLSDQEIAGRLVLSPRTIEQQLRSAYAKAEAHWGVANVDRTTLIALLNLYYNVQITGNPA